MLRSSQLKLAGANQSFLYRYASWCKVKNSDCITEQPPTVSITECVKHEIRISKVCFPAIKNGHSSVWLTHRSLIVYLCRSNNGMSELFVFFRWLPEWKILGKTMNVHSAKLKMFAAFHVPNAGFGSLI